MDKKIDATALKAAFMRSLAGRGITTPDDALYIQQIIRIIDAQQDETDRLEAIIRKIMMAADAESRDESRSMDVHLIATGKVIAAEQILDELRRR